MAPSRWATNRTKRASIAISNFASTAEHDGRRQNIQTTDQAQELLCVILASDEGIREHFNNRVTSDEQADLLKLISRLSCDPKTLRVFDPQTACQFEREAKA
ncbi:MAG: hypothetical protein IH991_08075 [Planctomycetes bacterium]|nr:hypothetical protein [Planctomycetota bacterium]